MGEREGDTALDSYFYSVAIGIESNALIVAVACPTWTIKDLVAFISQLLSQSIYLLFRAYRHSQMGIAEMFLSGRSFDVSNVRAMHEF